jgi:ABC-2 type transport system permease protein
VKEILLLWAVKLRSTINDFKHITPEKLIRIFFFGLVGIAFIIFDYRFFFRIINSLLEYELVGILLVEQLMGMVNLTLFSVLIFSNIVASLSTLYLSKDLNLLLAVPVPHYRVFIAKYVQTTINSSYMVVIFGLPIYCALGKAVSTGVDYYLWVVVLLIFFILIPAGFGILITMLLMRFFPAKRTNQVLMFMGMIFAAGLIIFFRFLRPETLYIDVTDMAQPAFMDFLSSLRVPKYPYLPSTWLTHAINDLVGIEEGVFLKNVLSLVSGGILVFVGVVWVAAAIYFSGFSQAFESKRRGRNRPASHFMAFERLLSFLDLPIRSVLVKDLKTFFRDTTQWSQLFLIGALIAIYLFSIQNIPATTLFLKNLTSFLNLGLAGFVISALAVRFVFPTTSLEGEAYWIIISSPLSAKKFLWGKFFIFLFPLAFMGELLIISSNLILGVDAFLMILSSVTILFITVGLTALGVGMGALFPRFRYENAAEIAAGFGGIFYMIVSLFYIGITIVIEARPVYVYFREQLVPGTYEPKSLVIAVLLLLVLNGVFYILPMTLGIRSLRRMEF